MPHSTPQDNWMHANALKVALCASLLFVLLAMRYENLRSVAQPESSPTGSTSGPALFSSQGVTSEVLLVGEIDELPENATSLTLERIVLDAEESLASQQTGGTEMNFSLAGEAVLRDAFGFSLTLLADLGMVLL